MSEDIFSPPPGYGGTVKKDVADEGIFAPPPPSSFSSASDSPEEERKLSLKEEIQRNPMLLLPQGLAARGSEEVGKLIEKAAYNAGGFVTDQMMATGHGPNVSAGAGYLANVGTQAVPAILSGMGSKAAASPGMESAAERVMQMALKPPLAAHQKMASPGVSQAEAGVHTLLRAGVNPNDPDKLRTLRQGLAEKRYAELEKSGAMVPTGSVADYVPNAMQQFRHGPQANVAIDELGKVQQNFLSLPDVAGKSEIPIQLAEKLKQGYQSAIGSKYGAPSPNPTISNIETAGEKQIARGLRELMADASPKSSASLASESSLINAEKLAARREAMSGNNQLVGMAWMNPLMLPFWIAERSPTLGGLMARALYSGRNAIPFSAGAGGVGAYMAGQGVAPGDTPMLDLTGAGALYEPPPRGSPRNRIGGGSR